MATIVAVCPYCRAGGVRAPANAVGASATCPKCGSSFTIMPSEGAPGWSGGPPTRPGNTTAAETKPTAALSDVTEPSPIIPPDPLLTAKAEADAKPKSKSKKSKKAKTEPAPSAEPQLVTAPVPASAPATESDDPDEATDFGLMFGLVAVSLVGVAVVASQFPYGRFIAAGLGLLGLLVGLLALGSEGQARKAGAAAVSLHLLLLLVVFLMPSLLSLDPWRQPPDEVPKGPFAVSHLTGEKRPTSPAETLDSLTSSWENQDVRVTLKSAHVGPVELRGPKDAKRTTKESYLHLTLRVSNVGVERELNLTGWAAGQGLDGLRVTDAGGKDLKPAAFDGAWQPDRGRPLPRVFPGHASEVVLLYAAPAKTDAVRVTVAGTAFGMEGEVKFRTGAGAAVPPGGPRG